jgi:NAD(P)-dependent dehydrogenase (short-subunit alcohol dehydrogenase family)
MATSEKGAVLITGASTGIGRATALHLERKGYRVFAGVRKQEDAESIEEEGSDDLTAVKIDVANRRSIGNARNRVKRAVGDEGLKALFNNAGIGGGGPIEFMPLEDFRQVVDVNLIGQIAVTQAFLPLIRQAERPTILFTSSIGGRIASPFLSPYNATKFAIEALADCLRRELAPWGIRVVLIEPGSIDTEIWAKGRETMADRVSALDEEAKRLYGAQLARYGEVLEETAAAGIPPEKVARVVERAIRKPNPKPRYLVGTDAKIAAKLSAALPDRTFDRVLRRQMKVPEPGSTQS